MSPRLLFAYLTLSLLEPLLALAKPPDLPVNLQVDCQAKAQPRPQALPSPRYTPPAPDYPIPTEMAEWEEAAEEAQEMPEEVCPCLDASCVEFLEVLGQIVQALSGEQAEEAEANDGEVLEVMPKEVQAPIQPPEELSPRQCQARHLYRIAERCRLRGDLDMARNCYEEVCRIAPKSPYGLLASGQLLQMKEQQTIQQTDDSEVQEPPLATPASSDEEQALIEELIRMAEQLRKHYHAEPVCPFRRGESPRPRPRTPAKPDEDQPMSDAEMQEMLDSAQLLDTFLDDLVYPDGDSQDGGVYKDILVEVTEQPNGSLMFGAGVNSNAGLVGITINLNRPEELTVTPAPRELTIVEEPQRSTDKRIEDKHRHRSAKELLASPPVKPPTAAKP